MQAAALRGVLAAVAVWLSTRTFRSYQNSV